MYTNGKFDMVKPKLLDELLAQKQISSFKRSEGWAVVGRDAVRRKQPVNDQFKGIERRGSDDSSTGSPLF
jgi:hypothetical protein